jgi:hypothetical protein
MGEKLDTLFMVRYFIYGLVLSLTSFFTVVNVEKDIRMVYNATCLRGLMLTCGIRGLCYPP